MNKDFVKITHELKVWPEYFHLIRDKEKEFEIRKNDRGFKRVERYCNPDYFC